MQVGDQSAALAFLTSPATHGVSKSSIKITQTHISVVVLAGTRAYKLKRAVQLPYVDFSTAERRLAACKQELELNRRTAPMLYTAVRLITREDDGRLTFDGCGEFVDAVVEMVRFDEETLFDVMAKRGLLTRTLLTVLASRIAEFHASAAIDHGRSGAARVAAVLELAEQSLSTTGVLQSGNVAAFKAAVSCAIKGLENRLDARERDGKVRRCHGDLHLRNICLVDGVPTIFDCIEFDAEIATVDVLYDLAFLLMDLWHRGLTQGANLVLNRYLDLCDETDGLPLMPLFMSLRAAIRALVVATQAEEDESLQRQGLVDVAQSYLELGLELLLPKPACLVAIGGLSGTGKSTLAAAIADRVGAAPGARVIASDRIRKRMYGVSAETVLPGDAYRSEVSEQVYVILGKEAGRILADGHSVIVDAVFDRDGARRRIEQVARAANVSFRGLWLEAPSQAMLARVEARHGDPSDATADVVRAQLARAIGSIDWIRINAGIGGDAVESQAIKALDLGER